MDVNYIDAFMESITAVMPQLGFTNAQKTNDVIIKHKEVVGSGVIVILGIVGTIKGNVVYTFNMEAAKQIASVMMMGMPVDEFDDMAKSAISELTNMLTANAATAFSNMGITIDISTPTMLEGENISIKMGSDEVQCIQLTADEIPFKINLSFEK